MRTIFALILTALLTTILASGLAGCGKSEYQSPEEFINSIDIESGKGQPMEATLPPVDTVVDGQLAKIRLETDEFDMGLIAYNELAHKKLMVYNDGETPLKISKIDTTCACTQGSITPENSLIQAGESSWIDVVVDPRRIPGFHSHKVLTITSSDPHNTTVEVGVSADVVPEFEIGPQDIDLGDVEKGVPFEKRIRFRQLIDETVNVVKLEAFVAGLIKVTDPGFTTEVVPIPEADWKVPGHHEFDLVFAFGPDLPAGPFTRYAHLQTDIVRSNTLRLTFTGTVIAPYSVTPIYPIYAELQQAAGEKVYKARINFNSATPIELGAISAGRSDVGGIFRPGATPNEAFLDVTYSGAAPVAGNILHDTLSVEVRANGGTYTEKVGVYINPAPGTGAILGAGAHDH